MTPEEGISGLTWLICRSTGIYKQGYRSPNLAKKKSSSLLLWLGSPTINPLPHKKTIRKDTDHLCNLKNMRILPSSIMVASLSTSSVPAGIWELVFDTTEQQRQLSCVVRWSETMERKIFTLAGIFGKHVLACTHLLRHKNQNTNKFF